MRCMRLAAVTGKIELRREGVAALPYNETLRSIIYRCIPDNPSGFRGAKTTSLYTREALVGAKSKKWGSPQKRNGVPAKTKWGPRGNEMGSPRKRSFRGEEEQQREKRSRAKSAASKKRQRRRCRGRRPRRPVFCVDEDATPLTRLHLITACGGASPQGEAIGVCETQVGTKQLKFERNRLV